MSQLFFTKSDAELNELQERVCCSVMRPSYKEYCGYTLPQKFGKYVNDIHEMEVFDDDIWVITYPKCGTTWTQEIVWNIMHDVDLSKCQTDMDIRFPFLEFAIIVDKPDLIDENLYPYITDSVEYVKKLQRPRFIKTHLPWELLPKQITSFQRKPKIVYVYRNPKDVCVSYYHHHRLLEYYTGTFEEFVELFLNDKVSSSPYIQHVLRFWEIKKNNAHIHLVKFEDLKTNLRSTIEKLSKFLDKHLNDEQTERLIEHVSFDSMKNSKFLSRALFLEFAKKNGLCYNPSGTFLRSGKVGGYASEMTPDMIKIFDEWIRNKLKNSDLTF